MAGATSSILASESNPRTGCLVREVEEALPLFENNPLLASQKRVYNMTPLLTTICPYWGRPEALAIYLRALKAASVPEVRHLILFVGEDCSKYHLANEFSRDVLPSGRFIFDSVDTNIPPSSIGHIHNFGAKTVQTEWIMKSDVDVIPHPLFFKELLPVLRGAGKEEWFNAGFIYTRKGSLASEQLVPALTVDRYLHIMQNRAAYSEKSYCHPQGSQFICRRDSYLALGGCCKEFSGWGWEDYQQLYMLERNQRGEDPLPGELDLLNVTQRCRDEISRPKAMELFGRNAYLCLLHCWHPKHGGAYSEKKDHNRQVLLNYITEARGHE